MPDGMLPAVGCWRRLYSGPLDVRWFGASGAGVGAAPQGPVLPGDTAGDNGDAVAIKRAIRACPLGGTVLIRPAPNGDVVNSTIQISQSIRIVGGGSGALILLESAPSDSPAFWVIPDAPSVVQFERLVVFGGYSGIRWGRRTGSYVDRRSSMVRLSFGNQQFAGVEILTGMIGTQHETATPVGQRTAIPARASTIRFAWTAEGARTSGISPRSTRATPRARIGRCSPPACVAPR